MFTGTAGTQVQGVSVHAKKGGTLSPSQVSGGNTCTVSGAGDEAHSGVVCPEKEKRARCLGIFQFKRPL